MHGEQDELQELFTVLSSQVKIENGGPPGVGHTRLLPVQPLEVHHPICGQDSKSLMKCTSSLHLSPQTQPGTIEKESHILDIDARDCIDKRT